MCIQLFDPPVQPQVTRCPPQCICISVCSFVEIHIQQPDLASHVCFAPTNNPKRIGWLSNLLCRSATSLRARAQWRAKLAVRAYPEYNAKTSARKSCRLMVLIYRCASKVCLKILLLMCAHHAHQSLSRRRRPSTRTADRGMDGRC